MKSSNLKGHYFTHLNDKSLFRCFVLLIPVFGNLLVGIYDRKEKKSTLEAVKKNGLALKNASYRLKCDKEIVFTAVKQNPDACDFAGKVLQKDLDVIRVALSTSPPVQPTDDELP